MSAQKIPRVSSQSDENILNANGGKLPRVKLNSGQGLQKNAPTGKWSSLQCGVYYDSYVLQSSRPHYTQWVDLYEYSTFHCLNANLC